ncbi:MAG TPA: cyclophilin-like fold protein, partial [Draconibacterium sp.]|nr:cyclophilin-like fold protein [Draconibacterium sp.]
MKKISIAIKGSELKANLLDTATADAIYDALPVTCPVNVWGDELYFGIPISAHEEAEAKEIVETGDLAFWPVGSAFCIFFGKTPV